MRPVGLMAQARAHTGDLGIVGEHHPALACGDVLGRVKRVDGGPESSEGPAPQGGAHRLARILDQGEPMLGGKVRQRRHIARVAVQVHRHYRPGARSDQARRRGGAQVQRVVDVGEDGLCAGVGDRVAGGDECQRARDDLVARTDAMGFESQKQGHGAVAGGDAEPGAHRARELLFKRSDALALGKQSGAHHLEHRRLFFATQLGPRHRDHCFHPPRDVLSSLTSFRPRRPRDHGCWRRHRDAGLGRGASARRRGEPAQ